MTRPSSMCLAVGQGSAFRSDSLSGLRLDPAWSSLVRDQVHLLSAMLGLRVTPGPPSLYLLGLWVTTPEDQYRQLCYYCALYTRAIVP